MKHYLLEKDFNFILSHTAAMWEEMRNQAIFITGGTGFFGTWLLESFIFANRELNLNATATVLTRNPLAFKTKLPHLFEQSALNFYEGDIKNFTFPSGEFSHIIHAATDASAALNEHNPILMFDTIVEGTKRTLDFAVSCGARRFLLASSGAVYGRQPVEMTHIKEEYSGSPKFDEPKSAYAIGKSAAEHMCCLYAKQHGLDIKIARCFAFVGPYLPLDIHFAIGNFIRDGLNGGPIRVGGDGSPYRSYLYAADLMIWLWTILFRGEKLRPYNVGSDEALNISQLANMVANIFQPALSVEIAQVPNLSILPERYVPDIQRAQQELGLIPRVKLNQAIDATIRWAV
jgi:nucleoside-diphosphate-sugar epimerase